MKLLENSPNRLFPLSFRAKRFSADFFFHGITGEDGRSHPSSKGIVYGLLNNINLATRIAKSAKNCGVSVHHVDRAQSLLALAKEKKPIFIILDWDGCEAEAFKFLKELAQDADLKTVPTVGYLTHQGLIRKEAERAGCHRVYGRSEFLKSLDNLFIRYAQ